MENLRLDQQYRFDGEWWIPDDPSRRFFGVLEYSQGQIRLLTRDSIETINFLALMLGREIPLLHGEVNSIPFSLCNSLALTTSHRKTESNSYKASEVLQVRTCLSGAHVPKPDFDISAARVTFESLEALVQQPAFEYQIHHSGPLLYGVNVLRPSEQVVEIPSIGAELRIKGSVQSDRMPSFERAGISVERWLELRAEAMKPFSWFNDNFWLIRLLLSTLIGRPVYARAVEGEVPDKDGAVQSASLLIWDTRTYENRPRQIDEVRLPFPVVRADSPDFLDRWFREIGGARIAVELFMGAVANISAYPYQRFVALVHALEAFHRHTVPGTYMDDAAYEDVAKAMVAAIPTTVNEDHRRALKTRVKFGNEYSLRKRLSELTRDLEPELKRGIAEKFEDFLKRTVDTRNYFTHWKADEDMRPFADSELEGASHRLFVLLRILFLRKLGLTAATIKSALMAV